MARYFQANITFTLVGTMHREHIFFSLDAGSEQVTVNIAYQEKTFIF